MVSKRTERKGYWLFKENKVKKELETDKRIHFTVKSGLESHSVIFDKKKNEWICDCSFWSLKFQPCSHIHASQLFKRNEENNSRG